MKAIIVLLNNDVHMVFNVSESLSIDELRKQVRARFTPHRLEMRSAVGGIRVQQCDISRTMTSASEDVEEIVRLVAESL